MSLNYAVAAMLFSLGIYCLLCKRNLIKMIMGLGVMTDGIHLLLISLGYRAGGIAAIVTGGEGAGEEFALRAVDPIPQALVLTSIVINICIVALALSLAIHVYRHYGTLNPFEVRRLRG
ncbi:MAG: NADH-quinone oxidoreductase subunit K [Candidatus Hadarchaeales archaeon]